MLDQLLSPFSSGFAPELPRFLRTNVKLQRDPARSYFDSAAGLPSAEQHMQEILDENVVPFWLGDLLDEDHGGFRLNHDVRGRWRGPAPRRLVTQTRTLWFFARLASAGHSHPGIDALANAGLAFLTERMWDREYGGFYWEIEARGPLATMEDKHAYGQAQALYALASHALASGSGSAARMAGLTFDLLEEHFHDGEHGGYREFLARDLSAPPAARDGYLGRPPGVRLLNTHLHLLEALIPYSILSGSERARSRLEELVDLVETVWVRPNSDSLYEHLSSDWRPAGNRHATRASYGHDTEMAHLLIAAEEVLERPTGSLDLCGRLLDHALRHGEDREAGGFYMSGTPGRAADDRRKVGWVQAETLLAMIEMYRVTGEPRYHDAFLRTLEWISAWQVDWRGGEWHAEIQRGRAYGPKVGKWHGPYHTGRALIDGLDVLHQIR